MLYESQYYGICDLGPVLEHHGILGQRWGKKNGPPYPLDAEDHSQRERKAGWRKSLSKNSAKAHRADNVPINPTRIKKAVKSAV